MQATEQKKEARCPKLHNAMWPGLVGKGSPGAEPCIDLETMLALTAGAQVNGARFEGIDLFLSAPHISIDTDREGVQRLSEKFAAMGFAVGSAVAPVWPGAGGGSAIGGEEDRRNFLNQVRNACRIVSLFREFGVRSYGVVRIDSACGVSEWLKDPAGNQRKLIRTFAEACDIAEDFGEQLAAEGEICWGGMHSWRHMLEVLQSVNRPQTLGFQADMAHTLLYALGHNSPEDALVPPGFDWSDPEAVDAALRDLSNRLRPWTLDFHVAQNDATVYGSGTHDKTGHHCLPNDPQGKLDIVKHSGYWLTGSDAPATRGMKHICWDGCMFPNNVMMQQQTWNDVLDAMLKVRDAHGWQDAASVTRNLLASRGGKSAGCC